MTSSAPPPAVSTPGPTPGLTMAWARFDARAVQASGAEGIADRRSGRRVTADDPVRWASVSKLAVAIGVMRLVERGRLDLDADVSRWLGWKLRNPAFHDRAITLRMLLSHTSSLQDSGEAYLIRLGDTLRGTVAAQPVFDRDHAPGTYFRYSNLNFGVIATVMERATGERFDRLMHAEVFAPLGMDACFNWTMCSDEKLARAVTLYRANGDVASDDLEGRRPDCPVFTRGAGCDLGGYEIGTNGALFSPQGGMRASVRDVATIGRMLMARGRHGGRAYLRAASVDAILRPAWTFDGSNGETDGGFYCAYGLGAQIVPAGGLGCRDELLGPRRLLGHAGEAYNLRSGLWFDPARRVGVAYFAANNPAPQPEGRSAFTAVEEWLAARIER